MQVSLLFFGILKDRFGTERGTVDLPESATVEDLVRTLRQKFQTADPQLWRSIAIAVNREYASAHLNLQNGDEVALLPPVSGGALAH